MKLHSFLAGAVALAFAACAVALPSLADNAQFHGGGGHGGGHAGAYRLGGAYHGSAYHGGGVYRGGGYGGVYRGGGYGGGAYYGGVCGPAQVVLGLCSPYGY